VGNVVVDELGDHDAECNEIAGACITQVSIATREVARRGPFDGRFVCATRQTQIDDVRSIVFIDDDVLGLEISVGESDRMQVGERFSDIVRDLQCSDGAISNCSTYPISEVCSFDPAKGDEHLLGRIHIDEADIDECGKARGEGEKCVGCFARERITRGVVSSELQCDEDVIGGSGFPNLGGAANSCAGESFEWGR